MTEVMYENDESELHRLIPHYMLEQAHHKIKPYYGMAFFITLELP